ncbi:MAG TPA: BrnT family toxin [Terracidiphilus sp.]|jgi:uncharacterized protein|nr:BrnT family toxin [Terracidiphilus sp.]
MSFEWDPKKAQANFVKHGVRFAEALSVFEDDYALTVTDDESDPGEKRFVSIGTGVKGAFWLSCTTIAVRRFA